MFLYERYVAELVINIYFIFFVSLSLIFLYIYLYLYLIRSYIGDLAKTIREFDTFSDVC